MSNSGVLIAKQLPRIAQIGGSERRPEVASRTITAVEARGRGYCPNINWVCTLIYSIRATIWISCCRVGHVVSSRCQTGSTDQGSNKRQYLFHLRFSLSCDCFPPCRDISVLAAGIDTKSPR